MDYWRQLDLIGPSHLDFEVTVIGVGGLGSPIALALAKMGCPRMTLIDPDRVEPHNIPNQLYRKRDIGRRKVDALAEILDEYADASIHTVAEEVIEMRFEGVVISAVDTMAARRAIWVRSIRYHASVALYVDARMGGEVGRIVTARPTVPPEVTRYETSLYADDEASIDPCTAQATIYATFAVAALAVNQVKRHARGEGLQLDQVLDLATSTLLADG